MAPPAAVPDLTTAAVTDPLETHNATNSIYPAAVSTEPPKLAELDPSKLKITITSNPKPFDAYSTASTQWGKQDVTTDHWITAKWTEDAGWEAPELKPYGPMELWPTASCLHYATECFEGMKAYRGYDGKLRLFRPNKNTSRMLVSSTRIALPSFSPAALEELIKILVSHDGPKWLPKPGTFFYIRPTMIGTGRALGVQNPREATLFIVAALFPVLSEKPMKLLASPENSIRAWPGGFGYAKVGANYGPSLLAQKEAHTRGYDQILWLFDESCLVTEAGASNFFVVWRNASTNQLELVTAPLDDKIILDGVTRRSILELARDRLIGAKGEMEGIEIVERKYTMWELMDAYEQGRLVEAFAAGTAYFITPVTEIHFRGKDIKLPTMAGTYTAMLKGWLSGVMYGKETHEWGVVVQEKGFEEENLDTKEIEEMESRIREMMNEKMGVFEAAMEKVKMGI
ncbi:hypothetical protein RUND412_002441 [Rhizina undulata]